MKINKSSPLHWCILILTGVNSLAAILYRSFPVERQQKRIILYGHKFNGNLRSFYNFMEEEHKNYDVYYLTMDRRYSRNLKGRVRVLCTLSLKDMFQVARSSVIITSHGSHSLVFLNKFTTIKFIDVWHGISYKGWGSNSFGEQKDYNQIWVSSPAMKKIYEDKYKFRPEIVKVTGYSRVDQLINNDIDPEAIILQYDIPQAKKYVLIAVTWRMDKDGRSIVPFDMPESEFFMALEQFGKRNNTIVIFRTHLNSSGVKLNYGKQNLSYVHFMPYHKYEVTEDFLAIADILVTDWSSIAFDLLPTMRPVIFLDVEPPFKEGFAIEPRYRFGPVVNNIGQFVDSLELYVESPGQYVRKYKNIIEESKEIAYGKTADGKSTERYFHQLEKILKVES